MLVVFPFAESSVCIRQCSGHGRCIQYSCMCDAGFYGDDCSTSFSVDGVVRPVMSAGTLNLTARKFREATKKHPILLVGYTSSACARCSHHENEYAATTTLLQRYKFGRRRSIPFARVDIVKQRKLAMKENIASVPTLVLYVEGRGIMYDGAHEASAILGFVQKQVEPPVWQLEQGVSVKAFLEGSSELLLHTPPDSTSVN